MGFTNFVQTFETLAPSQSLLISATCSSSLVVQQVEGIDQSTQPTADLSKIHHLEFLTVNSSSNSNRVIKLKLNGISPLGADPLW